MKLIDGRSFVSDRAWGSELLLDMADHAARIHWTDQPYRWHENTGSEVFVVLDGIVDMAYLVDGKEVVRTMSAGDIAVIGAGDSHIARPRAAARILVIERKDSE